MRKPLEKWLFKKTKSRWTLTDIVHILAPSILRLLNPRIPLENANLLVVSYIWTSCQLLSLDHQISSSVIYVHFVQFSLELWHSVCLLRTFHQQYSAAFLTHLPTELCTSTAAFLCMWILFPKYFWRVWNSLRNVSSNRTSVPSDIAK